MIRTSSRFAPAITALALAVGLVVGRHALLRPVSDPCRAPEVLLARGELGGGRVVERELEEGSPPGSGRLRGVIRTPRNAEELSFHLERGFEPSRFYGEAAVGHLGAIHYLEDRFELQWIDDGRGGRLPVHFARDVLEPNIRMRLYLLVHDGRPVPSALRSGIRLAGPQLMGGTRPVTVLLYLGEGLEEDREAIRDAGEQWIRAAWRDYQNVCEAP